MGPSIELQAEVRNWWESNPMTYDWRNSISYQEGTRDFFEEIDERFWNAAWFAHQPGEQPFSRLIDYPDLKGKEVLEIGCGAGSLTAQLAISGAKLTAIDLTEHATALSRRRFALTGLSGNILQMDARNLKFSDESFDFVWSWGVIHHSAEMEKIISEIYRVLKPGGEARLMVYHRNSIWFRVNYVMIRGILMGQLWRHTPQEIANKYSDGHIANFYTAAELKTRCEPIFSQLKTEIYGQKVEIWPLPAGRLKNILVKLTPDALTGFLTRRFGGFLFVSAIK
ncbi:MAG: class I SAM-dependent methyltransferase [Pyrinomonadaceae bacterium]